MLFNEKQIKGLTTELVCMQKFIELGYIVSVPYGNNSRYDLLVDTGKSFYRIQCKTASKNENGSYTVKTSNSVSTTSQRTVKHYTKEDIDFIATVIENQMVIIPVEIIENMEKKIFRASLPEHKNASTKNCNMIQDYTVEKFIN